MRLTVTYRTGEEMPLPNKALDDKIKALLATIGAECTGSGAGCGGRDLEFDLYNEKLGILRR